MGEQSATVSRAIMEMITTIMVYKFEQMSRAEVEAMLDLTLQETRVYQEARAEGREEGREEGERIGEQRGELLTWLEVNQLSEDDGAAGA